jgi:hypothetical protein
MTTAPAFEVPREEWRWQLLLRLPDEAATEWGDLAREAAGEGARTVRLITLAEGLSVQALHRGPYETEPETIAAMDALMEGERLIMNGPSRDLSDCGDRGGSAARHRDHPSPPGPAA